MCTDERLFAGPSDFAVLEKVRNATVPPPSSPQSDDPPGARGDHHAGPQAAIRWSAINGGRRCRRRCQELLMSQSPPWSAPTSRGSLKESFCARDGAEQVALEQYKRITEGDLAKYAAPATRRESAVSLLRGRAPDAATSPAQPVAARPDRPRHGKLHRDTIEPVERDPTADRESALRALVAGRAARSAERYKSAPPMSLTMRDADLWRTG